MSLYENYFLPKLLDFCCGMEGFQNKRSQIVPMAHGRVLEIGIGSGLNFDHYNFDKIDEIVGVDPAVFLQLQSLDRDRLNTTQKSHLLNRALNQ